MGCISGIVKTIMFIFNFACLLIGLVLLILGTLIYVAVDGFANKIPAILSAIPIVLIIIGAFIFLVSFMGCCGAIRNSKCMLITYAIIMIILLVAQLIVGIIGLVQIKNNYDEFKDNINGELTKTLEKYNEDINVKTLMNSLQIGFTCCGVNGKDDYMGKVINLNKYPGSCCGKMDDNETCPTDEIYDDGCGKKLFEEIENYIRIISIVAISICAVELLGALFAIYLSRKK